MICTPQGHGVWLPHSVQNLPGMQPCLYLYRIAGKYSALIPDKPHAVMNLRDESLRTELQNTLKRSRIVAWALVLFYPATVFLARVLLSSPEIERFYLWLYGATSVLLTLCTLVLYYSAWWGWRALLIGGALAPMLVETALSYPLIGTGVWWASLAAAIMGAQLFTRNEWRVSVCTVALVGIAGLMVVIGHPYFPHLATNEMSHGHIRYTVIQAGMAIASLLPVLLNNQIRDELRRRESEIQESLLVQQALSTHLEKERDEAERRRQEAEAALEQISRLQEEAHLRAAREAFRVRYERLMRTGYELTLQDFAQKVLVCLSEDFAVVGGLFYKRQNTGWQVIAAYALPRQIGTEMTGGILRIPELLRKPYLLTPVPDSVVVPRSALLNIRPVAILYLPLHSEVAGDVMAIIELLLSEVPNSQYMDLISAILPGLGTYWWGRQISAYQSFSG